MEETRYLRRETHVLMMLRPKKVEDIRDLMSAVHVAVRDELKAAGRQRKKSSHHPAKPILLTLLDSNSCPTASLDSLSSA